MIVTSPEARLLTWATTDSENVVADSSVAAVSDATTSVISGAATSVGSVARTPIVATLAVVCPINPRRVSFAKLLSFHRKSYDLFGFDDYGDGLLSIMATTLYQVRITDEK
jgi:hypothetical protein